MYKEAKENKKLGLLRTGSMKVVKKTLIKIWNEKKYLVEDKILKKSNQKAKPVKSKKGKKGKKRR